MLPPRYDDQKVTETANARHRERHFSHLRELRSHGHLDGFVSRVAARLAALRPAPSGRAPIDFGDYQLTDHACRLDDGSMGRVAIREANGAWTGICVKAPQP